MLTRKQKDLLLLIKKHLDDDGIPPSYDEMKDALGLKSKSGIHRLITALEERGFIRRLPHRARAIEVIRMHDSLSHVPTHVAQPNHPVAARTALLHTQPPNMPPVSNDLIALPLYGRIAAGTPIEALRDEGNQVDIPAAMLGKGEYYALEVDGDSMIDAGIHDGDTVVIRRGDTADNGDIVVALVEDQEVTLKRLRRQGNIVALEPANPRHETQLYKANKVKVQGRLMALMRKY